MCAEIYFCFMNERLGLGFLVACDLDDILIPSTTIEEGVQKLEEALSRLMNHGEVTLRPSAAKISAIEDFPVPRNTHNVRQVLGLAGHFRKFVPEFALKCLKAYLSSEPILTSFGNKKEALLYTDANRIGLAGMLIQVEDKAESVIGFYNRTTSPTEQRYNSFELEALVILKSLQRFCHYVIES
nr:unnamed protein product [Callosobruchus analis]